jgi:hypothetical protein
MDCWWIAGEVGACVLVCVEVCAGAVGGGLIVDDDDEVASS